MKTTATPAIRSRAREMPRPFSARMARRCPGVRGGLPLSGRASAPGGFFSTGPHWGSTINVLDRLLATRRLALHPVTQKIRQDHVIPAARLADLDDNDLELAELVGHLLQLFGLLDPAGVLAELVAEDVGQVDQVVLGVADRARDLRGLAVVLGRPQQHGVGVAGLPAGKPVARAPQRLQAGASLQRIVDDHALRPHAEKSTWPC